MESEIYIRVRSELKNRPKKLTDLQQWLFTAVNTAKSIIDNSSKENICLVNKFADCESVRSIQSEFDIIQGKFGREGFSMRYSPNYIYLCSLVADFPDRELSREDNELIGQYGEVDTYLLYEL